MTFSQSRIALCVAAVLVVSACGKTPDQQAREDAGQKMKDAGKQMEEALKQGGQGMGDAMAKMGQAVTGVVGGAAQTVATPVEPVDFRDLKAMLPESIGSMKRTAAEGEKSGAMGIVVSHAEGRYENDGNSQIGRAHV